MHAAEYQWNVTGTECCRRRKIDEIQRGVRRNTACGGAAIKRSGNPCGGISTTKWGIAQSSLKSRRAGIVDRRPVVKRGRDGPGDGGGGIATCNSQGNTSARWELDRGKASFLMEGSGTRRERYSPHDGSGSNLQGWENKESVQVRRLQRLPGLRAGWPRSALVGFIVDCQGRGPSSVQDQNARLRRAAEDSWPDINV